MLLAMPDGIKHHSANAPVNRVGSRRVASRHVAAAAKPKLVVTGLIDSTEREAAAAVGVAVDAMRCDAMHHPTREKQARSAHLQDYLPYR